MERTNNTQPTSRRPNEATAATVTGSDEHLIRVETERTNNHTVDVAAAQTIEAEPGTTITEALAVPAPATSAAGASVTAGRPDEHLLNQVEAEISNDDMEVWEEAACRSSIDLSAAINVTAGRPDEHFLNRAETESSNDDETDGLEPPAYRFFDISVATNATSAITSLQLIEVESGKAMAVSGPPDPDTSAAPPTTTGSDEQATIATLTGAASDQRDPDSPTSTAASTNTSASTSGQDDAIIEEMEASSETKCIPQGRTDSHDSDEDMTLEKTIATTFDMDLEEGASSFDFAIAVAVAQQESSKEKLTKVCFFRPVKRFAARIVNAIGKSDLAVSQVPTPPATDTASDENHRQDVRGDQDQEEKQEEEESKDEDAIIPGAWNYERSTESFTLRSKAPIRKSYESTHEQEPRRVLTPITGHLEPVLEPHEEPNRLVEARPVIEGEMPNGLQLPQAVPYDAQGPPQRVKRSERRGLVPAILFASILVAIIILSLQPPPPPPGGGVVLPTNSTMSTEAFNQSWLPPYTLLDDRDSPQYLAWDWVMKDPQFDIYPEWKIQQRFALATFYYATNGPGWINKTGYLEYDVDECLWHNMPYQKFDYLLDKYYWNKQPWSKQAWNQAMKAFWVSHKHDNPCHSAVTTTASATANTDSDGVYRYLQQYSNGLQGTIPPELFMLTGLKSWSFMAPTFHGGLPSEIGYLTQLEVIVIALSTLSESIPTEIGMLQNLKLFILYHNQNLPLEPIPSEIGQLSQLEFFSVSGSSFSGAVPTEIGLLTALKMVPLYDNSFTSIPSEIGLLKEALWLDAGNNLLTDIPSEIGSMSSLEDLELDSNQLDTIPTELGLLTRLKSLLLQNNLLTGIIPQELLNLSSLQILNIAENNFVGEIPKEFFSFQKLDVRRNTLLKGTIPSSACGKIYFDCSGLLCGCSCPCTTSTNDNTIQIESP